MNKFIDDDVQRFQPTIKLLTVHSFEMDHYLVELTIGEKTGMLYSNQLRPKRFHSSQQIRDAFAEFRVEKAIMIHDSPYDEMIGNPPKAAINTPLPFSI